MKTITVTLLTFLLLAGTSCQQKIDKLKEEGAIKAVFEAEKTAYFKQDYIAMVKFWVQDSVSKKIWFTAEGENFISGWEKIDESVKKEVTDTTWDRSMMTCTFSDYKIDVMGNSAWVTNKTNWKGNFKGKQVDVNQSRIAVMKKVDDKWKFALMAIYNFPMEKDTAH
jgi:ketosteroid isomerase-like protein